MIHCKVRETLQPMPRAWKHYTHYQARENITPITKRWKTLHPLPSVGKHYTDYQAWEILQTSPSEETLNTLPSAGNMELVTSRWKAQSLHRNKRDQRNHYEGCQAWKNIFLFVQNEVRRNVQPYDPRDQNKERNRIEIVLLQRIHTPYLLIIVVSNSHDVVKDMLL